MRKKLIAIFAGLISSLILPFLVSSASAEEVRSMKLWAREQAAGPAPHTAALIIAQTLNELGLDITVNAVPWPQMADQVWYKRLDEDTWDLTMWQMVSRPERSDPDEFTYNLFHYLSSYNPLLHLTYHLYILLQNESQYLLLMLMFLNLFQLLKQLKKLFYR